METKFRPITHIISNNTIRPLSIFENIPDPPGPVFDEVTIGTQTWMAADLAIDDGQGGIYTANLSDVNGYDLGTVYYYTHTAALRVADSINGWHLPTYSEWQTLFQYINNTYSESDPSSLRSTYAWNSNNGTNRFGFNILPVGNYMYGTSMESIGSRTCYWAYDADSSPGRYKCMRFSEWTSDFTDVYSDESDDFQFTVRLIKD